jgi:hypothetical protein
MTLKKDFRMANMVDNGLTILEKYEKIADEFAIGFAEWIWGNCFNIFNDRFNYKDDEYSLKELLEIYKKEKGL